jgi:hypothetical protein
MRPNPLWTFAARLIFYHNLEKSARIFRPPPVACGFSATAASHARVRYDGALMLMETPRYNATFSCIPLSVCHTVM